MNEKNKSTEEFPSPSFPAKKRFAKLGRKTWDESQQSASSTGSSSTSKSADRVSVRQHGRTRVHRHANRLSGVFLRGPVPDSMAMTTGHRSSRSVQGRKESMISADALQVDDPSELSNQITAPGILKIFGNEICEGAHYKSVLATTQSSAKELVKEALERYGLSKEEAESFVLCDTIGSIDNHQWRTEGFRVVGDHEKPLLLQSLWKPREGLARRFEIQRKSLVEEKTSKEKDTITAGINAQARKLQKSRSRVTSTLVEKALGRSQKLWRSKSEMDLLDADTKHDADRRESLGHASVESYQNFKTVPEQNRIHNGESGAKTETLCAQRPRGEREGEESEREETESSDDNTTQYSVHPPHDCPYLLLLHGCNLAQDFVIYLLAAQDVVIGRLSDSNNSSKADLILFSNDILPKHCRFSRRSADGSVVLCPFKDAPVTRNGKLVNGDVALGPGDVIGLGKRYVFLFKNPLAVTHQEENSRLAVPFLPVTSWILGDISAPGDEILCSRCVNSSADFHSSNPPFFRSPEGRSLTLSFQAGDERRIVTEIVAVGTRSGFPDKPPLTASFLTCVCIQHSSARLQSSDLRRLLLLSAGGFQSAVWEHTKNLAAVQSEDLGDKVSNADDHHPRASLRQLISGLRPLVMWMSNSLELLQFIQTQLPLMLEWRNQREQTNDGDGRCGDEESEEVKNLVLLELHLSCVRSASEEAMAVLEEIIMLTFQQSVYYITKFLYPILPSLLETNPAWESPDQQGPVDDPKVRIPGDIQQVLEVLNESWTLLSEHQVHPEISSQLIGYLFYFINASLFNSLMERGSEPGFYQRSRGVQTRTNLNLLLDWAAAAGLGELASEHTHALSSAVNLLAAPRKNLLQRSWVSLRSDYPALKPAQLNHLLSLYSPASPCKHTWTPSPQDQAAAQKTADVLVSFDTHHPLVLPDEGYQLQLRGVVVDAALMEQLHKLKEFITRRLNVTAEQKGDSVRMRDARTDKAFIPPFHQSSDDLIASESVIQNSSSTSTSSFGLPPSPRSLRAAPKQESPLQSGESRDLKRFHLDPTCLLTPHLTCPHETAPQSQPNGEGGLVFECLSALKTDHLNCHSVKRLGELQEEEERGEEEEADDYNEEVFILELERGDRGLGLVLVETRVSEKGASFKVDGIFIRAVVPDSPAAQCGKLQPGDRILAVNGVSLQGMDYQSGRELIQSGNKLRLMVARSHRTATAALTKC